MKKKIDFIPYVVVFALIVGWAIADRLYFAPKEHARAEEARIRAEAIAAAMSNGVTNATAAIAAPIATTGEATGISAPPAATNAALAIEAVPTPDDTPAQNYELKNDRMLLRITSRGAAVLGAEMFGYDRSLTNKTDHVALDFAGQTALAYGGIAGLGDGHNFTLIEQKPGSLILERLTQPGLVLRRTYELGSNYLVRIRDEFSNRGTGPITVPAHTLRSGYMAAEEGHRDQIGFPVLGVDTLSGGADGVLHWSTQIAGWFKDIRKARSLHTLPQTIETPPLDDDIKDPSVDWIAAKNKYFVQIIAPEGGADASIIQARRAVPAYEQANPAATPSDAEVQAVAGILQFNQINTIATGQSLPPRNIEYYVGPKKYDDMRDLRRHQVDVLEFGYFASIGKLLMKIMVFVNDNAVHNYGIAIMLLTLIVRTVFWPLTHKSTVSMKKMAKLQPEMARLREKYKDNPKKLQTEMIAFTRENKINPLAGCLPMLIQIPVFIALFSVIRSAIELRYASFLWIRDLSEPERIFEFGFTIPLLGWDALNILPIAMAITMYYQMKLTPTTTDPQQQQMQSMMKIMMPIMMLFMLYNYAAGLALYWTTSNIISIGQQIYYLRFMPDHPPVPAKKK